MRERLGVRAIAGHIRRGNGGGPPIRRLRALVVSIAAAVTAPMPAMAQQWYSPWTVLSEHPPPTVSSRQLRQYAAVLQLSPDQQAAAEALLAGYQSEHRVLMGRMTEVRKAVEEEYEVDHEGVDIWKDVWPRIIRNFTAKNEGLEKTFLSDLKALLDDGQAARWPDVERAHRRQTALRIWGRPAERLNLFEIVEGLHLDTSEANSVAAPLRGYELDLDRELIARSTFIRDSFEAFLVINNDKAAALYHELDKFSLKVVEVNMRHVDRIKASLSEGRQPEFELAVKRMMYPAVFKQTYAHRMLLAAEQLPDLAASQRETIKGIRETFEREMSAINGRWVTALVEQDQKVGPPRDPFTFLDDSEAVIEAREQRKAIEKRAVETVRAMLSADQQERLPSRNWNTTFDLDLNSPRP